jgi:photoactive yellow protein
LIDFDAPAILEQIERLDPAQLDALPFGLVAMTREGVVTHYNRRESELSGLSPQRVLGLNFFTEVAPCTNNFMVADRLRQETELDATLPYSFSVKLRPTPVTLRLLRSAAARSAYLLVQWDQ